MPRAVDLTSLYSAPINLWVEDPLVREYLSGLWNDPQVKFLVAGGNDGVRSIVKDAEDNDYPNVFGLIDRDYRPTNRGEWGNPSKTFRTFVLPVHEMENYLLNSSRALAECRLNNIGKTKDQIETLMREAAEQRTWWAACRTVIADLKRHFRDDFLTDPKCPPVTTEDQARNHICSSDWFRSLPAKVAQATEADIHQLLTEAHARALAQVNDGTWKIEFPGKEILRIIRSHIYDSKHDKIDISSSDLDIAFAKAVADWQVRHSAVPLDLTELRSALKDRIARNDRGPRFNERR